MKSIEEKLEIDEVMALQLSGNTKAYRLGKEYAEQGNVVVRGLALGCDISAHIGCLDDGGKNYRYGRQRTRPYSFERKYGSSKTYP